MLRGDHELRDPAPPSLAHRPSRISPFSAATKGARALRTILAARQEGIDT